MTADELPLLVRAHRLFDGPLVGALPKPNPAERVITQHLDVPRHVRKATPRAYRAAALAQRGALRAAGGIDARLAGVLAGANEDHRQARRLTADVVREAHHDVAAMPETALAYREALRRRVARLRAQRAHVLRARRQAQRHRAALRALAYRRQPTRAGAPVAPDERTERVRRAALSRLGRPYVWAATGPDSFDCSGLTQWSYAQAGVHIDRTTYEQINQGIPVSRGQIRPGDLVFPSVDHVQLAIGGNRVIEAPQPGGVVQISPLGPSVAIRRILP